MKHDTAFARLPPLPLVLLALCGFLFSALALAGYLVWLDLSAEQQALLAEALLPRLALLIFMLGVAAAALCAALAWAWRRYVVGLAQVSEQIRLMLDANIGYRFAPAEPGAWQPFESLQLAVNQLADQRDALREDVAAQILLARTSVEEERNRLAALMSELNQSVVVCNLDGRILLYNHCARTQFRAFESPDVASGAAIGLGRSIFALFDRNLLTHALESLQYQLTSPDSALLAQFVTAMGGGQLVRVQMAPVIATLNSAQEPRPERSIGGYVLMIDDITQSVENETRRDEMLRHLTEGSRSALANIRAAVETLLSYPDVETQQRERFLHIIADEVSGLGRGIESSLHEYADALKARWPLEEMRAVDLVSAAQRRIESRLNLGVKIDTLDASLWLKVDSYSLIQALSYLAGRLQEAFGITLLRFRLTQEGRFAHLDMVWNGAAVSSETVFGWELEPMNLSGENTPLTLHDIMDRHGGELWFKRDSAIQQAYFRLLIPLVRRQHAPGLVNLQRGDSRPEYYDFDLFKRADQNHALDERPLAELTYTVFDTETTGLNPSAGDEIIQFGAVRIVNGRVLRKENFEQLVDPRRQIAPESIAIHGIGAEMLAGQPGIERVLPAFHKFAEDTVLVAHNAAFDMRFLQLKEEACGLRFTQPVLDTLLLSAVLHPHQETHNLEAIAARFGLATVGRHTALGDAMVTAEVFLRMIPLLQAMGIRTLGEALAAARQTYYARIQY